MLLYLYPLTTVGGQNVQVLSSAGSRHHGVRLLRVLLRSQRSDANPITAPAVARLPVGHLDRLRPLPSIRWTLQDSGEFYLL